MEAQKSWLSQLPGEAGQVNAELTKFRVCQTYLMGCGTNNPALAEAAGLPGPSGVSPADSTLDGDGFQSDEAVIKADRLLAGYPSLEKRADELLKEVHYSGHDYPGVASAITHWASYLHATESLVEGLLDMSKGCFDEMEDWNNLLQAQWRPVTSGSPNKALERLLEGSWTGAPEWAGPTIRRRDPADRNSCVWGKGTGNG